MNILVALDSFKGCISSAEANAAVKEGIEKVNPQADVHTFTVSDGGEGWTDAFHDAIGGQYRIINAHDALMRPIKARYLVAGDTAVIEVAATVGLALLKDTGLRPTLATSYGVGEMLVDARIQGCKRFIIGLGGTATSDCGIGMLKALVHKFHVFRPQVQQIDDVLPFFKDCTFTLGSDVINTLCGKLGMAAVFAPQKGATEAEVELLDRRAAQFAAFSARHFGYDKQNEPGAGAAGGLGYAFLQYFHAQITPGADLLFRTLDLEKWISKSDMVITGEGASDRQTLMGKLPSRILAIAKKYNVPVALLAGRVSDEEALHHGGFQLIHCINPPELSTVECIKPETAKKNLKIAVTALLIHR